MTNAGKFIEIMNETFGANLTENNMKLKCSPCGALKKDRYACSVFKCEKCAAWWRKEYEEPQKGE
ncbi:MAG: hypothetical protein IKN12_06035 [Selenomonadaceae bacterium]|nr:hypothetical protein [Selenomonadaceae bacterium]